jgi:hypothetical protein
VWLSLTTGFISISCAKRLDQPGQPIDVTTLMLRARRREHLEELQRCHPDLIGHLPVQESRSADYPFRLVVPKGVVAALVAREVERIGYGNFKQEAGHVHGHASPYLNALHRTWSVMRTLDPRQP